MTEQGEAMVWCYRTICPSFINAGTDNNGTFGYCNSDAVVIDKDGRCWNK